MVKSNLKLIKKIRNPYIFRKIKRMVPGFKYALIDARINTIKLRPPIKSFNYYIKK